MVRGNKTHQSSMGEVVRQRKVSRGSREDSSCSCEADDDLRNTGEGSALVVDARWSFLWLAMMVVRFGVTGLRENRRATSGSRTGVRGSVVEAII